MRTERRFADARQLAGVVQEVFGTDRSIASVDRLAGGTKKGVYRVALDDGTSTVVYVWSADEDYWDGLLPDSSNDPESVFAHSSGIDLFEAATRRMESVGARSPRLFFTDRSKRLYPGEIAVAEDLPRRSRVLRADSGLIAAATSSAFRRPGSEGQCGSRPHRRDEGVLGEHHEDRHTQREYLHAAGRMPARHLAEQSEQEREADPGGLMSASRAPWTRRCTGTNIA